MISTFNGRPTSEMSKAELIDALDVTMGLLNAARRALAFEREATMQRFTAVLADRPLVIRQVERADEQRCPR